MTKEEFLEVVHSSTHKSIYMEMSVENQQALLDVGFKWASGDTEIHNISAKYIYLSLYYKDCEITFSNTTPINATYFNWLQEPDIYALLRGLNEN